MLRNPKTIRQTNSDTIFDLFNVILMTVIFLVIAYPLYFIVIASISDPNLVNTGKVIFTPKGLMFDGYDRIFKMPRIWMGYRNTIVYTIVGTSISVVCTITGGYALSQDSLPGKNIFIALITFSMFFSGGLIPTYLLIQKLGILDSIWAMTLPGAVSVWNLLIARTFFRSNLPDELHEAAKIDGASQLGFFFTIALPLTKALTAIMVLFYFVGYWNEFFRAIVFLKSPEKDPLQMVLRDILIIGTSNEMTADIRDRILQQKTAELVKYGVIIVSTLPLILIYPFVQKFFIQGVLVGSIKS